MSSYPKITFYTPCAPLLFAARGCGALLIKPRPLSGYQIKAEIKGFLLRNRLFLYYQWFFQNIEKGWDQGLYSGVSFQYNQCSGCFQILNSKNFRIWLLHPVLLHKLNCVMILSHSHNNCLLIAKFTKSQCVFLF